MDIYNIDSLTNEQLFKIYENFALPLSKRHKKYRNAMESNYNLANHHQNVNCETTKQHYTDNMLIDEGIVATPRKRIPSYRIDESSPTREAFNLFNDYQCQLSTATKRIKISLS